LSFLTLIEQYKVRALPSGVDFIKEFRPKLTDKNPSKWSNTSSEILLFKDLFVPFSQKLSDTHLTAVSG
jgi:hypothetical protein